MIPKSRIIASTANKNSTPLKLYPKDTVLYIGKDIAYSIQEFYAVDLKLIDSGYVWSEGSYKYAGRPVMYGNVPLNIKHTRFLYPGVKYLFYKPTTTRRQLCSPISKLAHPLKTIIEFQKCNKPTYILCNNWEPGCVIIRGVGTKYYESFSNLMGVVPTYTLFRYTPVGLCDISIS